MKSAEEIIQEIERRMDILKQYIFVSEKEMRDVILTKMLGSRYIECESLLDWIKKEDDENK